MNKLSRKWSVLAVGVLLTLIALPLGAQEEAAGVAETAAAPEYAVLGDVDALWTCLAAFLVFFMQAGFACVEGGLTRAKNICNILMKNLMDMSIGAILFWMLGFGIMFGITNGIFGTNGFFFDAADTASLPDGQTASFGWAFLIFQTVFCATAATIVSGAMAERTKFVGYLLYTVGISVLVYPVFGSWAWGGLWQGGGWLENMSFLGEGVAFTDFAGSTVVHSIGGWAALAGAIVIGPRLGKFRKDGKVMPIPGHSIPLAGLGVFILWLGWFGFNPGSTTAVGGGEFALIAVNTNIAACGGAVAAMFTSWILFKKPDVSFSLNGVLAGLVAITAGCYDLSVTGSLITGLLAGALIVFSVLFFDKIKVDDPVGAVSVHGVCGVLGTLCVGLFSTKTGLFYGFGPTQLVAQAIGVGVAFLWAFPVCLGIFYLIKVTVGLRVSAEEELQGLDLSEHGMEGYPGFAFEAGRDAFSAGPIHADQIPDVVSRQTAGAAK